MLSRAGQPTPLEALLADVRGLKASFRLTDADVGCKRNGAGRVVVALIVPRRYFAADSALHERLATAFESLRARHGIVTGRIGWKRSSAGRVIVALLADPADFARSRREASAFPHRTFDEPTERERKRIARSHR